MHCEIINRYFNVFFVEMQLKKKNLKSVWHPDRHTALPNGLNTSLDTAKVYRSSKRAEYVIGYCKGITNCLDTLGMPGYDQQKRYYHVVANFDIYVHVKKSYLSLTSWLKYYKFIQGTLGTLGYAHQKEQDQLVENSDVYLQTKTQLDSSIF